MVRLVSMAGIALRHGYGGSLFKVHSTPPASPTRQAVALTAFPSLHVLQSDSSCVALHLHALPSLSSLLLLSCRELPWVRLRRARSPPVESVVMPLLPTSLPPSMTKPRHANTSSHKPPSFTPSQHSSAPSSSSSSSSSSFKPRGASSPLPLSAWQSLQRERMQLPIHASKQRIVDAVKQHNTVILVGETGSGQPPTYPAPCLPTCQPPLPLTSPSHPSASHPGKTTRQPPPPAPSNPSPSPAPLPPR